MASVLGRESRSRRCDRATRAPASSRSGPSRRGDASACASSSPGRPRNLAGAHDFFERVRSSLGWREPQPRVRRNASALSQTLAGRVRGSVRVAARLDLWRAGPIAEARSFPLIFEFGQLACLARLIGRAVGGSSGGVRTRRLNLVVIFSFSRSSQEKPRPRAPPRIRRHFAPHRSHGAEKEQEDQDIERRGLRRAARCAHTGAAGCVRG